MRSKSIYLLSVCSDLTKPFKFLNSFSRLTNSDKIKTLDYEKKNQDITFHTEELAT